MCPRCVFVFMRTGYRSDSLQGRNVSYNVGYGIGSQTRSISVEALKPSDTFPRRHNSATPEDQTKMTELCGFDGLDSLIDATVPKAIRIESMKFSKFDEGLTESQMVEHMQYLASKNKAEISQGRLESLLNFQTMITDLTGLPMSNASLLDEGTAAAGAMAMCNNILKGRRRHLKDIDYKSGDVCGVLVQYPGTEGEVLDYGEFIKNAHANGVKVVMATDLLALTLLKPPGELGADIVVGSAQRFEFNGLWGPHAAFLATSQEYKRMMPGRIIGVSVDSSGKPALRMAMQTRGNISGGTRLPAIFALLSQLMQEILKALLANMAAMYAVYHGPEGKNIAQRVHGLAGTFALGLKKLGTVEVQGLHFFDTVKIKSADAHAIADAAYKSGINLRVVDSNTITASFDETTTLEDVDKLFKFLHLASLMIPLGSCTMKLNATTEMMPVAWPNFTDIHPFAPAEQAQGYQEMFNNLGDLLCTITGFDSFSLQPNAGAAGEYAGLMVIRAYHLVWQCGHYLYSKRDHHRNVCIIPVSAHGTNPASAAMCGMKIVSVGTDAKGNINIEELRKAAEANRDNLSALMVTYPSTHGVYEEGINEICKIIHDNGGQVGLTSPGWIGADVCHLNLHKTFCIHGGGGRHGSIGVKKHLAPFLPSHPVVKKFSFDIFLVLDTDSELKVPRVAYLPRTSLSHLVQFRLLWGSALILPISYTYIAMMGSKGLTDASKIAILNANYMAKRLENYYPVLFRGVNGTVAHEFIIDLRGFQVPGTLMIEPTESESKAELDRYCDALISIREEIIQIEKGKADINNNVLKVKCLTISLSSSSTIIAHGDSWTKPYSGICCVPAPGSAAAKFWPTTGRVDNVYGTATSSAHFNQFLRLLKNRLLPLPLLSLSRVLCICQHQGLLVDMKSPSSSSS
ncbi:hypothetical protein FNV43_RR18476 [Rhamnella rubrinervis]|uniref:glycine dehydrogenase (aminomethyl-transferring) n=1 Tax=Rhamnella rubrinervis TaxID=2594499 RepID=A0A8K0DZG6_9ROSA|nr:hypothetical protein FNV43_RR18476 [Rhamnella rubrinervis]